MRLGRVYEEGDGKSERVLVDRLWPRGVRKDDPRIDRWVPEVAPSSALRKWYGHDPARFEEFSARYEAELGEGEQAEAVDALIASDRERPVKLLTATKDVAASHMPTLRRVLEARGADVEE